MKLGKALATGVAEERPQAQEEELRVPEEAQETAAVESASEAEEVPAGR